jgi:hypothetical protein
MIVPRKHGFRAISADAFSDGDVPLDLGIKFGTGFDSDGTVSDLNSTCLRLHTLHL